MPSLLLLNTHWTTDLPPSFSPLNILPSSQSHTSHQPTAKVLSRQLTLPAVARQQAAAMAQHSTTPLPAWALHKTLAGPTGGCLIPSAHCNVPAATMVHCGCAALLQPLCHPTWQAVSEDGHLSCKPTMWPASSASLAKALQETGVLLPAFLPGVK